ncbi:MAG: LEA type 2 family protein [Lysobacter sp.]|nr:LEA type 2 family protein [Lysobacter sp.]
MRQRWAMRLSAAITAAACLLALSGCVTGPVRRVSEPTASIQQLSVGTDGQWTVALRLQNFSNVPMRFERIAMTLRAGTEVAGELQAAPALTIGPESADVVDVTLAPSAAARIVIADALADRRSLDYSLEGKISAAAEDHKARDYKVKRNSALSPVPGLPGVMR